MHPSLVGYLMLFFIPRGPVSIFLTATNLEANASFACWIFDTFSVEPSPFLPAIRTHLHSHSAMGSAACILHVYHSFMYVMRVTPSFLAETFLLLCLPLSIYFVKQKKIIMDITRKKMNRTCVRTCSQLE